MNVAKRFLQAFIIQLALKYSFIAVVGKYLPKYMSIYVCYKK